MEKYTIFCTEEQTLKAIGLGAPIDNSSSQFDSDCTDNIELLSNGLYAIIPTAEQMIGWLEEQEGLIYNIQIYRSADNTWSFNLYTRLGWNSIFKNRFNSRQEATLTAIDKALEYLINERK